MVGPYEVLEPLGTGGMGKVFRARDTRLQRLVAIKRLRSERQGNADSRTRFQREAEALAKLNHPAIVQVYDWVSDGDAEWIVTEYVEGSTLRQRLENGPLVAGEAISLARRIAEGLAAAHAAGVVHRDLKTENVLVTAEGEAKIVDFGVAKQLAPGGDPQQLTGTGALVGTVRSMSPEQVQGLPVGPASDLFSLGVLIYETVCGVSPFAGDNTAVILRRIVEERQQSASELAAEVPAALSQLIDHLMAKDPRLRPQSARQVAVALERMSPPSNESTRVPSAAALAGESDTPSMKLQAAPPFPRRRLGLAVLVMGLLLIGTIAITWPRPLGYTLDALGLLGPSAQPEVPELPSIAVLPFVNLSGDPELEVFCDGLTEDLTIDLSRSPQLFVISRSSAFTFKAQPVTLEQVGRELGVRYVLEGTVRRSEDLLRITARLSNAVTGFQVWSLRYDRSLAETFELQLEIAREILTALQVEIDGAELQRIRDRAHRDLTAYHAFLQGRALLGRNTRQANAEARRLFERAVALDPDFAEAYALLGVTYGAEVMLRWTLDPSLLEREEELARRALALDPESTEAYVSLATVHSFRDEPEQALVHVEKALASNPNHSPAHALHGVALAMLGHRFEALRALNRAARLNPRAPSIIWSALGVTQLLVGRKAEAIALWERVRSANPDLLHPRVHLMWAYGAEAQETQVLAREIRTINPQMTAEVAAEAFGLALADHPAALAERSDILRRGGLP